MMFDVIDLGVIDIVCLLIFVVFGLIGAVKMCLGLFENDYEAVHRGRHCMLKALICASLIYIGYNIFFVKLFGG